MSRRVWRWHALVVLGIGGITLAAASAQNRPTGDLGRQAGEPSQPDTRFDPQQPAGSSAQVGGTGGAADAGEQQRMMALDGGMMMGVDAGIGGGAGGGMMGADAGMGGSADGGITMAADAGIGGSADGGIMMAADAGMGGSADGGIMMGADAGIGGGASGGMMMGADAGR